MNRLAFFALAFVALCGLAFAQSELCADLTDACELTACQNACDACTDECFALDFPPATYACSEPFTIVSAQDVCENSQPSGDRPARPSGDMPPSSGTPPPRPSGDRPARPSGESPMPRPSGEMPPARPSGEMPPRPSGDRPPRPSGESPMPRPSGQQRPPRPSIQALY